MGSAQATKVVIKSPFSGQVVPLADVPDPIFSQKMVGDGAAVDPAEEVAYSPVSGKVAHISRSGHAVGIVTQEGLEILLHIGIDTYDLAEGFTKLVEPGQRVASGQPLLRFDRRHLKERAPSLLSPVLITNLPAGKTVIVVSKGSVAAGSELFVVEWDKKGGLTQ